jgi:hypothetical protein
MFPLKEEQIKSEVRKKKIEDIVRNTVRDSNEGPQPLPKTHCELINQIIVPE